MNYTTKYIRRFDMLQSPTKPTQWGEKGNGFYFYSPYFIFAKIYYFGPIFFINGASNKYKL